MKTIKELAKRVLLGDRRALSRAITLVESSRQDHRAEAMKLIQLLNSDKQQAMRIGLSGAPGVGKSTFIESFGMFLTGQDLSVAVLAVDPSSSYSGGSILGDKTRMEKLTREKRSFVRPSPSGTHLGGVARNTREAVRICEAAGFDIIIVETVGVGQSETIVSEVSDIFLLILSPAGGDELQGVKRGIMEMADVILVNKADGELKNQASQTCADFAGAARIFRKRIRDPEGYPKLLPVSATNQTGLVEAWDTISELITWRKEKGFFEEQRAAQASFWFEYDVRQGLLKILDEPEIEELVRETAENVREGLILPQVAAADLVKKISNL